LNHNSAASAEIEIEEEQPQNNVVEVVEKDENSLNLKTVKRILIWWGATVPVALFVSYAITSLLLLNQPASVDPCP
jgi:phosphate/sulfate permease